jgi:hypothetical protein
VGSILRYFRICQKAHACVVKHRYQRSTQGIATQGVAGALPRVRSENQPDTVFTMMLTLMFAVMWVD